jgi:putative sigma-54 modulation protein
MEVKEIQIKFISLEPTEAVKDYVYKKLSKIDNFLEKAIKADVVIRERIQRRGVDKDFRVDINIYLPKCPVIVQEEGEDVYALIDKSVDVLTRRLKRYNDKLSQWEGKKPWKVVAAEEAIAEFGSEDDLEDYESYTNYVPKISVHKKIEDMRPLEDAEAIEEMELMGFNQLLFRSKRGKFCMVYKREDGTYGLVEPADSADSFES